MPHPDQSPLVSTLPEQLDETVITAPLPPVPPEPQSMRTGDDSRLRDLLEPSRVLFDKYRQVYTESLQTVLHSGGLQLEGRSPDGTMTLGAWRVGVGTVETSSDTPAGSMYRATHIKVRGSTGGHAGGEPREALRPPLVDDYFDLTEAAVAIKGITDSSFFQADTLRKVTIPLSRSSGGPGDYFEHEVAGPDGSTATIPYVAPKEEVHEEFFPSYSDVLKGAIPPRFGKGFQGLVQVATTKARHQIAQTVWEVQFADAFSEGRELPGVPKSPPEAGQQNLEQRNPLRLIAQYAGAGMLAELDTAEVARTFMDPRIRRWANGLRFIEATEFEIRDITRDRAQWAADYAETFQKTVEGCLGRAHGLIRDHVILELKPFMQVAQGAAAFALDVLGGAPIGENYDGFIWRKVDDQQRAARYRHLG